MSVVAFKAAEFESSDAVTTFDADRRTEIDARHERLAEFMRQRDYDAVLLRRPENFSWFTVGGDNRSQIDRETIAALFVTKDSRVIVCRNADSTQLFDHEVPGLGFQLKERAWHEPLDDIVSDFCQGRRVASDSSLPGVDDVSISLSSLRLPVSNLDRRILRYLGKVLTHAVEATARSLKPGTTEQEAAAEVAFRLMKHEVELVSAQVAGDGQLRKYRHWKSSHNKIEKYCTIFAFARHRGLHLGVARTVSFGNPPYDLTVDFKRACLVHGSGMFYSRPRTTVQGVWKKMTRVFEKFGCTDEWRLSDQAMLLGYRIPELKLVPNAEFRLQTAMPLCWYPSIGVARAGDSIILDDHGFEKLTPTENWPSMRIEVRQNELTVPGIYKL